MTTPQTMRESNFALLNKRGFKPAAWLPLPCEAGQEPEGVGFAGGKLRSEIEIANRLLCHCAAFAWGSAPSEFEPQISQFIANNKLYAQMTDAEKEIVDAGKDEANAEFAHTVGWRLENIWSLAWVLGVAQEPSATTGQLSQETSGALMSLFLPEFDVSPESLLAQGETQTVQRVIQVEDLFYLAHNAVRSAQIGEPGTVPEGFDPMADGGAIHERRHSLTWSLALGATWDETDLST